MTDDLCTTFIHSSSSSGGRSSSLILHASKNEGLESGFEVDRLGKAEKQYMVFLLDAISRK